MGAAAALVGAAAFEAVPTTLGDDGASFGVEASESSDGSLLSSDFAFALGRGGKGGSFGSSGLFLGGGTLGSVGLELPAELILLEGEVEGDAFVFLL